MYIQIPTLQTISNFNIWSRQRFRETQKVHPKLLPNTDSHRHTVWKISSPSLEESPTVATAAKTPKVAPGDTLLEIG